jgi:membrane protein DedA with SNARE-associated domain
MPVKGKGEAMEGSNVDWTTLILGAALGVLFGAPVAYLIGILSNMHAIRFMQFRDNRKLLKKAKTRQQALLIFQRIKAFREGKRDKYPFY